MVSLSLSRFMSQTSNVSELCQEFGNPNTVLAQKCMQVRCCSIKQLSMFSPKHLISRAIKHKVMFIKLNYFRG